MKRILITGANSYIGTSFAEYMAQWPDAYQVDAVDMIDGTWREKDFSGYDCIYHVAGIAHSDVGVITEEQKSLYYEVNTDLTIETAQKAKNEGVKQFIFMSSAIVYGDSAPIGKRKVITRDTPVNPANCYGDSKVQAEKGLALLNDDSFKVVILRPPMIYGPGSKGNYVVLSKLAQKLPVFPKVNNERSMLYIGNLVEFVRLVIAQDMQGVFWPQNSEYVNTTELVRLISKAHGKKMIVVPGLGFALKFLSLFSGKANKAFGSLCYDKTLNMFDQEYCKCSLAESIDYTEGKNK